MLLSNESGKKSPYVNDFGDSTYLCHFSIWKHSIKKQTIEDGRHSHSYEVIPNSSSNHINHSNHNSYSSELNSDGGTLTSLPKSNLTLFGLMIFMLIFCQPIQAKRLINDDETGYQSNKNALIGKNRWNFYDLVLVFSVLLISMIGWLFIVQIGPQKKKDSASHSIFHRNMLNSLCFPKSYQSQSNSRSNSHTKRKPIESN
uniref:Uncharacterized protein n=1 Tax=Romanomermis culicivorax TaxID=13658 RepID=A0A915HS94_ROMCU